MADKVEPVLWEGSRLAAPHVQHDKAWRVRRMFDAIAPTYERVNRLASLRRDRYWRREMVRLADVRADDLLLDVACGTGDVARAFGEAPVRPRRIIGLDFAGAMLDRAARRPLEDVCYWQGDALKLPLADEGVTLVTCAFGLRNFQCIDAGLGEMYRVLKPGGRAVILEFSLPQHPRARRLYLFYFRRVMPRVATWLSRDRTGAYRYLPESVVRFSDGDELGSCFRTAGFRDVTIHPLTLGIVTIWVATKSDGPARG